MNRNTLTVAAITGCLFSLFLIISGCDSSDKNTMKPDRMTRFKSGGKYGFSGTIGGTNIYISPQFDFVWKFSEGLAVIAAGRKFGYINLAGDIVVQPQFDMAYDFSEGMAKVKLDGKYGFVNSEGKLAIGFEFDNASSFVNGYSEVKIGKEYLIIDKAGHFVNTNRNTNFMDLKAKFIPF